VGVGHDVLDSASPEDLAEDTLTEFFMSPDALGWDGRRDLGAFLCGVLKHKFIDRLRRHQRTAGSLDDEDFAKRLPETLAVNASAHGALEIKERIAHMKGQLGGDTELEKLVDSIVFTNGDHNINQQLADDLGTTVEDVRIRRKRLKRLLGKEARK
jgi:hypothetical protein